jgi:hypothetical protein
MPPNAEIDRNVGKQDNISHIIAPGEETFGLNDRLKIFKTPAPATD